MVVTSRCSGCAHCRMDDTLLRDGTGRLTPEGEILLDDIVIQPMLKCYCKQLVEGLFVLENAHLHFTDSTRHTEYCTHFKNKIISIYR